MTIPAPEMRRRKSSRSAHHARRAQQTGRGVEIPPAVNGPLGLDDLPSWLLVSEGNEFVWPGYDLRKRRKGGYSFGILPPRPFDRIAKAFVDWHRAHAGRLVSRD